MVTDQCYAFLFALHENNCFNWVVLNKAHLILTAGHYREQLGLLEYLRILRFLFAYLTAIFLLYAKPNF